MLGGDDASTPAARFRPILNPMAPSLRQAAINATLYATGNKSRSASVGTGAQLRGSHLPSATRRSKKLSIAFDKAISFALATIRQ